MASYSCRHLKTLLLFVAISVTVHFANAQQRITPPPPGKIPVEANGKLYNIEYVPGVCKDPYITVKEELEGGMIIKNKQVLMKKYGPFYMKGNIEIAPTGCLVIMPGTEIYFDPGSGMIVNGTLIARVSFCFYPSVMTIFIF